jgi:hypothetical protein
VVPENRPNPYYQDNYAQVPSNVLINLDPDPKRNPPFPGGAGLTPGVNAADPAGQYLVRAVAHLDDGDTVTSRPEELTVLSSNKFPSQLGMAGFTADELTNTAASGDGSVYYGEGGTDTLWVKDESIDDVVSLDGEPLLKVQSTPGAPPNQAIYHGSAFDYLRFKDGREIYFQGIEQLRFKNNASKRLQVTPVDPKFNSQWNLIVTDVPDAWRFTTGSKKVLLVSLDSSLPAAVNGKSDLDSRVNTELIRDEDNNPVCEPVAPDPNGIIAPNNHGNSSISILVAHANDPMNNAGIAGINWTSTLLVANIYFSPPGGLQHETVEEAIIEAMDYASQNNIDHVVFQDSIATKGTLSNAEQTYLKSLLMDFQDNALFAVSAGSDTFDISNPNPSKTTVGGWPLAQLSNYKSNNVIAVGALKHTPDPDFSETLGSLGPLENAKTVFKAYYSNYSTSSAQVYLMAPTDSPSILIDGTYSIFTGTSAAAPNMAGIASLVWGADPKLTASEVRNILQATAMPPSILTQGQLGATDPFDTSKNYLGYGLVDAGAAVRRAFALQKKYDLANLYLNNGKINPDPSKPAVDVPLVPPSGPSPALAPAPVKPGAGSSPAGSVPASLTLGAANPAAASAMAHPYPADPAGARPAGTAVPLAAGQQAGSSQDQAGSQGTHAASSILGATASGVVTVDRTPDDRGRLNSVTSVNVASISSNSTLSVTSPDQPPTAGNAVSAASTAGLSVLSISQDLVLAAPRSAAEPAGLTNGATPAATATVLYLGPGLDSFTPAPASSPSATTATAAPAPDGAGASVGSTEVQLPAQSVDWSRPAPLFSRLEPRISSADAAWPSHPAWDAPERSQATSPGERSLPSDPIVLKAPRSSPRPAAQPRSGGGDRLEAFLTALFDQGFLDRSQGRGRLGPAVDDAVAQEVLAARTTVSAGDEDRSIATESVGNARSSESDVIPSAKPSILRLADGIKSLVLVGPWLARIWPLKSRPGKKTDEETSG